MVAYTRDAAGRLTGMSSVVASYFFTRDGNGRIVHTIETEPLSPVPVASSTAYSYNDARNRLLSAGAVAYGYDDEGQVTSAGSAAYGYDYEHRLAAIGSDARFEYDGRGNRLRGEASSRATSTTPGATSSPRRTAMETSPGPTSTATGFSRCEPLEATSTAITSTPRGAR